MLNVEQNLTDFFIIRYLQLLLFSRKPIQRYYTHHHAKQKNKIYFISLFFEIR